MPPGVSAKAAKAAETAKTVKYAVKNIININVAGERASPCAAAEIRVHSRLAELIITCPFVFVGKHLIGFVDLFEL